MNIREFEMKLKEKRLSKSDYTENQPEPQQIETEKKEVVTGGDIELKEGKEPSTEKKKLISEILNNVKELNFIDYCKSLGWKPSYTSQGEIKPPQQKHIKVATIEYLIESIKAKGFEIKKDESETIYLFNGAYWLPFYKDDIIYFLENFAVAIGIAPIEAKEKKFKDELYNQLLSVLYFQEKTKKPAVINLLNGTFDIKEMRLREFRSDDFLVYQLPYKYNPETVNELWLSFLDEIIPNKETQQTLQEIIGSLFVKDIKLEYAYFLYGSGANGKSVFIDVISAVLGDYNVSYYSLDELMEEHYRAFLKDKIVNFGSENDTTKIKSAIFKKLASGEKIGARLKYGNPFMMENYAKLIFAVNQMKLAKVEYTTGFFRRFLIVPFKVTIPDEKRDKELAKKILTNNPEGILNWIIEGAYRVSQNKDIYISKECKEAKRGFIKEIDSVLQFIEENNLKKSESFYMYLKNLYAMYSEWCKESGYNGVGKGEFSKRLEALGYRKRPRDKNGVAFYITNN